MDHRSRKKQIETLAAISLGLFIIYFLSKAEWPLYVIPALLFTALFVTPLAGLITMIWLKITGFIGKINGYILLSVIFYLVITPVSLLRKLLRGKNFMQKNQSDSMYVDKQHTYVAKDLEHPW